MMRAGLWIVLGCLASACASAGTWSNLWRTPDQQGAALLAAGHARQAADRFVDPRLKAYAEIRAGRYRRAARLLAPFKDPTSEYNRGNALARSGHLHAALAAYDAALKQSPRDADIRHNRDLVARMLKRETPKKPPKAGAHGRSQGNSGSKGNPPHDGQGKSGAHGASGARDGGQPEPGQSKERPGGKGSAENPGAARTAATPRDGAQAGAQSAGSSQHRAAPQPAAAQGKRPGPRPIANSGLPRPQTAAATRSAGDGLEKSARGPSGTALSGNGVRTPPPKPVSEKTLALEQWLRQIPNNPAGLLRRKFLIEYMMKHPGENP